jgi:hypothetical protein
MSNIISVITSDIIGSSQIPEFELKTLQEAIAFFPDICKNKFPDICEDLFTSFNNYRGDEYQIVLSKPELGFRIAVLLRLYMYMRTPYGELNKELQENKKDNKMTSKEAMMWKRQLNCNRLYDIRSSIGIGSCSDVLADNGEAFVLSGHGLDALKSQQHTFTVDTCWKEVNEQLNLNMEFIEMIMSRWTPVQGRIAAYHFMNVPREKITKKVFVTHSAVSQALKVMNTNLIERIIRSSEDIIRVKLNTLSV